MRYPLISYASDGLEITMSEPKPYQGDRGVQVFLERWNPGRDAFDSMDMWIPNGKMQHVVGFPKKEVQRYEGMLGNLTQEILDSSQEYANEDSKTEGKE